VGRDRRATSDRLAGRPVADNDLCHWPEGGLEAEKDTVSVESWPIWCGLVTEASAQEPQNVRSSFPKGGSMAVKLGELVLREGLITEQQLEEGLAHQKAKGTRVGEALMSLGYLSEEDLASCLSKRLGVPLVDPDQRKIDAATLKLVPAAAARMHRVLPLSTAGVVLRIAMVDPTNLFAMDDLKFMTGHNVEPFVAPQTKLLEAIERYYGKAPLPDRSERPGPAGEEAGPADHDGDALTVEDLGAVGRLSDIDPQGMAEGESEPEGPPSEVIDLREVRRPTDISPVVRFTSVLFVDSLKRGASDVLLEPYERDFRIRYRVDGVLHTVMALPVALREVLASRIKTMFRADIAKKNRPQAGTIRLSIEVDGRRREVDYFVSCVPTVWGECIHLKLVDRSARIPLDQLGLEAYSLERVRAAVQGQRGMILLTGPRGSGVTTTFYSALASVDSADLNVMTLEPRVEVDLPGVNQVALFDEKEISGADSVHWLARHDANVIGVSEIQDPEMWGAVVTAAQDAVVVASIGGGGTVSRLVRLREAQDARTRPQTFAGALRVVIGQRLVRRICPDCRTEDQVHSEFLSDLGYSDEEVAEATLYRGTGCDACAGVGYRGRVGLFEALLISPGIRDLLVAGADADRIKRLALEEGMVTLQRSGLEKVKAGITTIEEVLRETEG